MGDEDEDVVFEGSELHKHFENIGVAATDYLCAIRSDTEKNKNLLGTNVCNKKSRRTFTIINGLENPFRKKCVSQLEALCCETYFKTLLQSEALTHDDAMFLENCMPSNKVKDMSTQYQSSRNCYKLLAAVGLLTACLYSNSLRIRNISDVLSVGCISILLLLIYIVNESSTLWDHYIITKTHQQNQKCLKTLADNCSTFIKLLQKCILIIQEFELVDRGFTLLLPQISFRSADSPSKTSRHHCPGLRHVMFVSARKTALMFRAATTQLRHDFKLNEGIDHESHYLSSVPIEEFGFHLSDDPEGFDVDPLSVSALKSTWQLSCMQISEYFRRLCLSLHIELYNADFKQIHIFRTLSKFLVPLDRQVASVLLLLQQSYQFHKNPAVTEANVKLNSDRISPQSHLKGVKVAVHSLCLHLQSALSRVLDIEKELEAQELLESTAIDRTETCETLLHLLQTVKMELNACQTCQDESQSQLDMLLNKKPEVPKFPRISENLEHGEVVNKNNPIPLFEMGDPISEDQIFEAYISDNESQTSDNDVDYFVQRDEQKKRKETTKLMLSELQTILTVRADDWRKRERRALAKAKGIDVESLTSDDEEVSPKCEQMSQQFTTDKNEKNIFEFENCVDPNVELNDDVRKEIKRRLQDYSHAPQLDFTASIAALAASRSREMNFIATEVFSDSEIEENLSDSDI